MQIRGVSKMKNKLLFNNTYESGRFRILIYKKNTDNEVTAVCLEFGLIIKAKTKEKAQECIKDVADTYLKNVIENKLSEELLNRSAPKKYWTIFEKLLEAEKKSIKLQLKEESRNSSTPSIPPFNLMNEGYQDGRFNFA